MKKTDDISLVSSQWGPARSTIKIDVPTTKNSGRKNNFCLESDHHHQWSIDYVFWQPLLLAYSSVLEDCADWWNTRFICKPRFLHLSLGVQGVAIYWSTLALIWWLTAFDVNDASRSGHQLQHQYANWQMSWLDILMIGYQETSKTSSTCYCWNMKKIRFSPDAVNGLWLTFGNILHVRINLLQPTLPFSYLLRIGLRAVLWSRIFGNVFDKIF